MKKSHVLLCLALPFVLAACQRSAGEVASKIKYDFGIGEKPEGYVSGTDKVQQQLDSVGKTEMKRLNVEGRHGEVEFQEESGLQGKYYKEIKVYENYYPLEARAVTKTAEGGRGFVGYIDYTFRILQSERFTTRTEAAAASANLPTDVTGRETYRYNFSSGGTWNGQKGELSQR